MLPMLTPLLKLSQRPPTTVLSFSAGQDSAMLLALALEDRAFRQRYIPGDFLVAMADTGCEHPETGSYREQAEALCRARDIPFLHVTPDLGHHSPAWQTLHTQWARNTTIQARRFPKTCSVNLKIYPFYRALNAYLARTYGYPETVGRVTRAALYAYAQDYGRIPVMIGFTCGEERRLKPAPAGFMTQTVHRIHPLMDLGLDRRGCQEGTRQLGFEVPYPSNCMHCPFHGPLDLMRLHTKHPDSFALWADFEDRKLAHPKWQGGRNHTVMCNDKTLWQNLEDAYRQYGPLPAEELDALRMRHGHGNTTSF
ncbi:hypothetical protein [Deinococcus aluminii]|uniref:Phosphoadenosine phosphosulfate reductase family protein n=1 Tax=Deinococcus aluminii TaxID=1656885 RepID=A0ABP9XEP6_9DEIO